jgi:cysteine synthase A/argininosuccinate lyase
VKPDACVIVETPRTGAGESAAVRIRECGVQPVLLSQMAADLPAGLLDRYAELGVPVVKCATFDLDEVVRACGALAEEYELRGIASFYEYTMEIAARAALVFGVPGPDPDAVARCRDKPEMRDVLRDRAPELTVGHVVGDDAVLVAKRAAELGFPVVVKPVHLTGSAFVKLCASEEEVRDQARLILAIGEYVGLAVRPLVQVEEYVHGTEFSVEVVGGHAVAVTRKLIGPEPYFIELGHLVPAPEPESVHRRAADAALTALRVLGLGWGAAHVELRLSGDHAKIIEVNPRLAGDRIPELVRLAIGVDLTTELVRAHLGLPPGEPGTGAGGAAIAFAVAPPSGRLRSIQGVDDVLARPDVAEVRLYKGVGVTYESNGSNRDRVASVIATGESSAVAAERANDAVRALSFDWQEYPT